LCTVSIFIIAVALIPRASALSLRKATFEELRQTSDCIVRGHVASLIVEETSEPNTPGLLTRMKLDDTHVLKGIPPPHFSVVLPGGETAMRRAVIPGAPKFSLGEDVILLLRKTDVSEYALLGHALGVVRVNGDQVTPDLFSEHGPQPGEKLGAFLQRFKNQGRFPALLLTGVIALLLLVAWKRNWRKLRVFTSVLLIGLSLCLLGSVGYSKSINDNPECYAFEGGTWNLSATLPGRVRNRRVQWVQGRGPRQFPVDDAFSVIRRQFQQWEDVSDSDIAFQQDGTTVEAGSAIDERNVVSFLRGAPHRLFDDFTLAITFLVSDPESLDFIDTDIVFNDDLDWTLEDGQISIASVALHEIGHFLGLDHTREITTVMYPITQGLTTLSPCDAAGARALYPPFFFGPTAVISASPAAGAAPLTVSFSSDGSSVADGGTPNTAWIFGDGSAISNDPNPQHTYSSPGIYTATVFVSGSVPGTVFAEKTIYVTQTEAPILVRDFTFQTSLLKNEFRRGHDSLKLILNDVALSANDILQLSIGMIPLEVSGKLIGTAPARLNTSLRFNGRLVEGGHISFMYSRSKRQLSVRVSSASFGILLDPRGNNDTSQSGNASFPFTLAITRAGQSTTRSGSVNFNFSVQSGKGMGGLIEKSIRGQLPAH
jgi:PKD repeat protein